MTATSTRVAAQLIAASRLYPTPDGSAAGIHDAHLTLAPGEFLGIVGASGSGKSTLLNLLSGIDRPTGGSVHVAGADLSEMDEDQLAQWRGRNVGVVFQFPQLIPTLTVAENVMLPMDFLGAIPRAERPHIARELLDSVGLAEHYGKAPGELSGGQQQRVAIARALANSPQLIVADEPTGNLDSSTGALILTLLRELADRGTAVVMVTHERERSSALDRVVTVADGRIVAES
jgi:putative ABC transport system ATP-binding protein